MSEKTHVKYTVSSYAGIKKNPEYSLQKQKEEKIPNSILILDLFLSLRNSKVAYFHVS